MKKGQEWSDEQIEYLKTYYPSERAEDIALVGIKRTKYYSVLKGE